MTSDDHTHDALFAVLRAPARPDELSGEADAVAAMVAALEPVPARHGSRSRRGLVLAAVTVASLGVGGLAAAGPGIFTAPFTGGSDRSRTDDESLSIGDDPTEPMGIDTGDGAPDDHGGDPDKEAPGAVAAPGTAGDRGGPSATGEGNSTDDDTADVECAEGNHGATVSEVATSSTPGPRGDAVSDAARSACGKPGEDDTASDDEEPGRSGDAPGRSGDQPGVGNDGTPGPPVSTPGQGQPPTDPGPPASTPGQGQPPTDPGPPVSTPGQGQPGTNPGTNQGQRPSNPGPPASTPGQGNGQGKPDPGT